MADVDEVIARYYRRRNKVQQREKALADLRAAILASGEYRPLERAVLWLDDALLRFLKRGSE